MAQSGTNVAAYKTGYYESHKPTYIHAWMNGLCVQERWQKNVTRKS